MKITYLSSRVKDKQFKGWLSSKIKQKWRNHQGNYVDHLSFSHEILWFHMCIYKMQNNKINLIKKEDCRMMHTLVSQKWNVLMHLMPKLQYYMHMNISNKTNSVFFFFLLGVVVFFLVLPCIMQVEKSKVDTHLYVFI